MCRGVMFRGVMCRGVMCRGVMCRRLMCRGSCVDGDLFLYTRWGWNEEGERNHVK